jgi:uncharacterized protein (TIGR02145 family)
MMLYKLILFFIFLGIMVSCNPFNKVPAHSYKAILDTRDGQRYGYVEIKGRYWLTENMRYNVPGSKCNPNNPDTLYGRLYNWPQAMKACPEGWRLTSTYAWSSLERFFIESTSEIIVIKQFRGNNVKILKAKKGWATSGTDSLRLNILPAGVHDHIQFEQLGKGTFFWTSDSHIKGGLLAENFAYFRYIHNDSLGVYSDLHEKKLLYFSCRCVKSVKK